MPNNGNLRSVVFLRSSLETNQRGAPLNKETHANLARFRESGAPPLAQKRKKKKEKTDLTSDWTPDAHAQNHKKGSQDLSSS